jgi:hypothetical protein
MVFGADQVVSPGASRVRVHRAIALALNDWFYFDWITRDFFAYLYHRTNGFVAVPGTFKVVALGDAWQSRAASAYHRAVKACAHEYNNRVADAGDEWQWIFGTCIPRTL